MIYFQILVSLVIVSVIPNVWADRDSGENVKQRTKATTTSSTTTTTTPAQITTTPPSTTTSTTTSTTPSTITEQPTSATTTETTITATPTTTTTTTPTTTTTTTPTTTTTTPTTTTTTTPTTTTTTPTTTTPTTTTTSGAPSGQCGVSDVATGTSADTCATYPWIVRLDIGGFAVCVGAILDATHILTAAHCVSEAASITAYVGEYDASVAEGTEQTLDVDMANGISYHPKFSYDNKNYDVAVLTLSSPIDFTRPCAAPVCVAAAYHVTPGQTCQTAGWAVVNFVVNDIRESAPVKVYPGTNCATTFPFAESGYFTDPSTQLCAEQACATNGGGPLFCLDDVTNTWNLVGVTSYGEGCDAPGSPGVYTDVSVVYDWIQQQL